MLRDRFKNGIVGVVMTENEPLHVFRIDVSTYSVVACEKLKKKKSYSPCMLWSINTAEQSKTDNHILSSTYAHPALHMMIF